MIVPAAHLRTQFSCGFPKTPLGILRRAVRSASRRLPAHVGSMEGLIRSFFQNFRPSSDSHTSHTASWTSGDFRRAGGGLERALIWAALLEAAIALACSGRAREHTQASRRYRTPRAANRS